MALRKTDIPVFELLFALLMTSRPGPRRQMTAPVVRAAAAVRRLPAMPTIPESTQSIRPSSQKHLTKPSKHAAQGKGVTGKGHPQRTSKTSQKLVVLPSEPQKKPLPLPSPDDYETEYDRDRYFGEGDKRSAGERMTKEQRAKAGYKRLTAYCVADGIKTKSAAAFLKREHGVSPRVYDEAVYVVSLTFKQL